MSVFLRENRKISLAAGGYAPFRQILGAPLILHIIFAYYSYVDDTE